jgi:hypothetical protein
MGRSRSAPTHHGPPGWCPSSVNAGLRVGDEAVLLTRPWLPGAGSIFMIGGMLD